jgi:hypothetical protein
MLLGTTAIVDFKWPSVKRDRLSTLLLFRRGKKHTHAEMLLNIAVILNPKDLNTGHFSFDKLEYKSCNFI